MQLEFKKYDMRHVFNENSIEYIENGLKNNEIKIRNPIEYFDIIGKLPNNGYRIKWKQIENISMHPPDNVSGSIELMNISYENKVEAFLKEIYLREDILDDICILIEDHFSDCALEMNFKNIINLVSDFIYSPGHKYIISKDNDWIINITMEGDIYFSKLLQSFINN